MASVTSDKGKRVTLGVIIAVTVLLAFVGIFVGVSFAEGNSVRNQLSSAQEVANFRIISTGKAEYTYISEPLEEIDLDKEFNFAEVDFAELKERNQDIVAWLSVQALDMSTPVVQGVNNEYYLTHDLDGKENKAGWVFADSRNRFNSEIPDYNTIIYGHNRSDSIIFGKLKVFLKESTYENPDNLYIQFNTEQKAMVFQLCSVYITDQSDWGYFETNLTDVGTRQIVFEAMQEKNQMEPLKDVDFGISDTVLTLSTCHGYAGTSNRLVVHAKLIAMKSVEQSNPDISNPVQAEPVIEE